MVAFCLGTVAELIKCYPVMRELTRRKLEWCIVSTGQSPYLLAEEIKELELASVSSVVLVETTRDLSRSVQAFLWFLKLIFLRKRVLKRKLEAVLQGRPCALWIVHGDTLSTLAGAALGRRLGFVVAHIEAGLRSGSLWSPFPEEINRRLVSLISGLHFAPNEQAKSALLQENISGKVWLTEGNTQLDALELIVANEQKHEKPQMPYAIANLHRFENLNRPRTYAALIDATLEAAKNYHVYFIMHPQTQEKLRRDKRTRQKLMSAGVELLPRLPFPQFAKLLANASFILADGAGNQDDSALLGLPCLILRDRVESQSGLAPLGPCVLSRFDTSCIRDFLRCPERYKREPVKSAGPSAQIADIIEQHFRSLAVPNAQSNSLNVALG
jgi:UDP-N-acetylglucosamine 2-epimerase (non-hydrolysing)